MVHARGEVSSAERARSRAAQR